MNRIAAVYISVLLAFIAVDSLACTTAVISARASYNGRPMLWKQRDTSGEYNYVDFFDFGRYDFTGIVASDDTLRASVWAGANEVGFAIMNSQSYGLSPRKGVERPYEGMIMKAALANCATVDEFENYIAQLSKPNGLEANFGVIDAYGAAAYFEVHDYAYVKYDANEAPGGWLVRSNWSVSGREGEGRGYERSERAQQAMSAHEGGFEPLWFWDTLACDELICRATSVSSTVIVGVNAEDRPDASTIWCDPGYARCSYPIACWVAAGKCIPTVLRSERDGGFYSPMNELANDLKYLSRDRDGKEYAAKVLDAAAEAAALEYRYASELDELFRSSASPDEALLKEHEERSRAIYENFVKTTQK